MALETSHPPEGRRRRIGPRGSALYILLIIISVLFIAGLSVIQKIQFGVRHIIKFRNNTVTHYLAESGLHLALQKIEHTFRAPLVLPRNPTPKDTMKVNSELLDLLDVERAREWARTFDFSNSVMKGSNIRVTAEFFGITRNEFSTNIDRVDIIPQSLEPYRNTRRGSDPSESGASPLGGWSGRLKLTSVAEHEGSRTVLEVIKGVKVLDVTCPAPDHCLFIDGPATEYLKTGKFIMSNLTLPDVIQDLLFDLGQKINELLKLSLSESKSDSLGNIAKLNNELTNQLDDGKMPDALKLVYELAQHANDEEIKDTVDNIILSLNPRDWGRVRTNGVLHVYLPFFAADDIINYFADTSIFGHQRPEIGYLYNDNRLHDPYLSVYTHFEGYIYKNYRRLNPLILGPTKEPQVVPPQRYTINTRMNYVKRYPDRKDVANLARLKEHASKFAHSVSKKKMKLIGTVEEPLQLNGLWYCKEDITIGGPYQGRGLVVTEKNIIVTDDITAEETADVLGLVSLQGKIVIRPSRCKIKAGLYAKEGVQGGKTQGLDVVGNLAVHTLSREKMPRSFSVRFDPDLKNHTADNLIGTISRRSISYRELSAAIDVPDRGL